MHLHLPQQRVLSIQRRRRRQHILPEQTQLQYDLIDVIRILFRVVVLVAALLGAAAVVVVVVVVVVETAQLLHPTSAVDATGGAAILSGVTSSFASSSSSSSSFLFCSASSFSAEKNSVNHIRALDEYGNAQQLQYAMNAANENGRRIVVLTNMPSSSSSSSAASSSVWIVSPIITSPPRKSFHKFPFHRFRPHHETSSPLPLHHTIKSIFTITTHSTPQQPSLSSSSSSLLHPVSKSTSSFMIATGIGSDIHYLIQQLRMYYKYNYERYNHNMGITSPSSSSSLSYLAPPKVTSILQLLLRQFWDYPNVPSDHEDDDTDNGSGTAGTWLPTGYRQLLQPEESSDWGRPLGVSGMILQWNAAQQQYIITDEFDPTGIVVRPPTIIPMHDSNNGQKEGQEFKVQKYAPTRIVCLGPQHELIREELMKAMPLWQQSNINYDFIHCNTTSSTGTSESDDHSSTNTTEKEEDISSISMLKQQIITTMECVIQSSTKSYRSDNLPSPRQYQIEILDPPPSTAF
jgi:hypothetical protein